MPTRPVPVVGADPASVQALTTTCGVVDAGAVLVVGDDTSLAYDATLTVARADAGRHRRTTQPADPLLDVHPALPDAGTWTVAEVEEKVIRPARITPLVRGHVVVADAHAMAPIAADRLLKALEEPRTDVVFWLVVPDPAAVPATVAARAVRHVHVRPVPPADRVRVVVAAGADPAAAERACAAAGDDTRLAAAAALTGRLAHLERFAATPARWAAPGGPARPTVDAAAVFDDVCALAAALAGQRATGWDQLSTTSRSHVRRLTRVLLGRVAEQVTTTPFDVPRAEAVLAACRAGYAGLDTGTPVWAVLALVAHRCAHPGRAAPRRR